MPKFIPMIFIGVALCSTNANAQWYADGSLHSANGRQWKAASQANQLATSADFAAVTLGDKKVKALGSMSRLKPYAAEMDTCIDEAVSGSSGDSVKVSEVAAVCAILMGWK